MMKKTDLFMACATLLLLLSSPGFAFKTAVLGGIRNDLALGVMFEEKNLPVDTTLRLGFEANTSNPQGIIFISGKAHLMDVNKKHPLFLSGGLVAYLSNATQIGPYISLIFEPVLDVTPLFLEFGIDIAKSRLIQAQVGYYFL